jgi:hypothetical protein
VYCIANGFNLNDVAAEDALRDVPVFQEFCRIEPGREPLQGAGCYDPDERLSSA